MTKKILYNNRAESVKTVSYIKNNTRCAKHGWYRDSDKLTACPKCVEVAKGREVVWTDATGYKKYKAVVHEWVNLDVILIEYSDGHVENLPADALNRSIKIEGLDYNSETA